MATWRVVLDGFVRYGWIVQMLIGYFVVQSWRVLEWFMELQDPTAVQAGIVGVVLGILPTLGTLLTFTVGRTAPPSV